jgi:hypothetical protein
MSGNYKVSDEDNVSYDVHLFIKSVYKCFVKAYSSDTETWEFLDSLETFEDDRHPKEIPSLNPLKLLKHKYFDSLREPHENVTEIYGF